MKMTTEECLDRIDKNVAFIPVRGGSKSIPLKNIRPLCGKPLVYWTVKAACECPAIDRVYVATDSDAIRTAVNTFKDEEPELFCKAEVIGRSEASASDTASTESAMLEFADAYSFENIVLVQATSPMLTGEDLQRGFDAYAEEGTDSVLSVVPQKRFHWAVDGEGFAHPTNYDVFHRPRRQDFDAYYVENGAFYICSREALLKTENRVSGRIKAVEMDEMTFFEIDEPSDWIIIEKLMEKREASKKNKKEIKMFLTDCDGCLTDGGMYYAESGDELKKFNTRDGMGFGLLRKKGVLTGIITSESVELNRRRADKLKLDILVAGCKDKLSAIQDLCSKYDCSIQEVLYIGDDINDISAIRAAGIGCCPADAMPAVKEAADYISEARGGEGVIREIAEKLVL